MKRDLSVTASDLPSLKSLYNRSNLTAILLSVMVVGLLMGSLGVSKLLSMAQMNLQLVTRSASVAIEAAVYFDDKIVIREQLGLLLPQADVSKAQLVYPDGVEFLAWEIEANHQLNIFAQWVVNRILEPEAEMISFQNQELARLILWPNGEQILRFMRLGFSALLFSLLITAFIILMVTRRLHRELSKPLLELAAVSSKVRTDRDFSVRVSRSRIAEIDSLRVDFNALLDELHQWQSSMESLNQHLHYHANHDSLTGLANRHYFEKTVQRALDFAVEQKTELCILYLDGNDFKKINDTYGHATGDEVLRAMSQRIKSALRETDLVARVGGDEFCVLLNHLGDLEEINRLKVKISDALKRPLQLSDSVQIDLSASIGMARFPQDGESLDALMHAADHAMYQTKRNAKILKKHYDTE